MNRETIIEIAREIGIQIAFDLKSEKQIACITYGSLERFAAAIRAATKEEDAKRRGVLLFNPYTGKPRHPSDIRSDPHGILMLDPEQPILASK